MLNSTTLHNVLLPGAGTGGKTGPCRAMKATSDTVRRFRLPVPGSRLSVPALAFMSVGGNAVASGSPLNAPSELGG